MYIDDGFCESLASSSLLAGYVGKGVAFLVLKGVECAVGRVFQGVGQLTALAFWTASQLGNKLDFCLCLLKGLICCASDGWLAGWRVGGCLVGC